MYGGRRGGCEVWILTPLPCSARGSPFAPVPKLQVGRGERLRFPAWGLTRVRVTGLGRTPGSRRLSRTEVGAVSCMPMGNLPQTRRALSLRTVSLAGGQRLQADLGPAGRGAHRFCRLHLDGAGAQGEDLWKANSRSHTQHLKRTGLPRGDEEVRPAEG